MTLLLQANVFIAPVIVLLLWRAGEKVVSRIRQGRMK